MFLDRSLRCFVFAVVAVVTTARLDLRRSKFAVVTVVTVVTTPCGSTVTTVTTAFLCHFVPFSRSRILFESCVGCVGGRGFRVVSILKYCVDCVGSVGGRPSLPTQPTLPTLFFAGFESPHSQILRSLVLLSLRSICPRVQACTRFRG